MSAINYGKVLLIKERMYPYLIPALVCIFIILKFGAVDVFSSKNLNDALTAIITVSSITIGFMGAMLPVILSMKNDSKVIQYVFQKDERKLFLKYIKSDLAIGLVLILCAIVPYFKDLFQDTLFYKIWTYVIIYTLLCFLCVTYRCLNNILNLIFKTDDELGGKNEKKASPEKLELDKRLKERQQNITDNR